MMIHTPLKQVMEQWGGGTIADSTLHNKLFYQLSTFISAYSKIINDKGYDCNDSDIDLLKTNILSSIQKISLDHYNDTGTNNEYGILYSLGNSGYICFGKKFNNFCIQWYYGPVTAAPNSTIVIGMPLAYSVPLLAFLSDTHNTTSVNNDSSGGMAIIGIGFNTTNSNAVYITNDWNVTSNYEIIVFSVGIL